MAKKNGKKKVGAKKAPGASKSAKKAPARTSKPKSKKKAPPKPVARSAGGARIDFVCSECYEEFTLSASQMQDTLTCPECLHVGKRPQEDFLAKVSETKGRERRVLMISTLVALIAAAAGIGAAALLAPYGKSIENALGADTAMYAIGGGFALAAIIGLVLAIQYERNRWEVYF